MMYQMTEVVNLYLFQPKNVAKVVDINKKL